MSASLNSSVFSEYLHYQTSGRPFFYFPVMKTSTCKWNDDYVVGEFFVRCSSAGELDVVIGSEQYSYYGDRFLELILNNDKDFTDYLLSLKSRITSTADFFEKLSYENLKNSKEISLDDFYDRYEKDYGESLGVGYSIDYSLDQYIKKENISIVQKNKSLSFLKKEQLDLARISRMIGEQKDQELAEHVLKYSWLLNNNAGEHRATFEYFQNRLNDKVEDMVDIVQGVDKPQDFLEWVEFLTIMRDERKRMNLVGAGLMDRCIPKICADLGITREQVIMHTVDEIRKNKNLTFVSERYIWATHLGIVDKSQSEWEEEFEKIKIKEQVDELRGIIANKGKAVGAAKIIVNRNDFSKVEKGDILVASMTRPEFAPIFPLCGAIVTNEGGITCHAAIISRELGKPCIIGTKVAMQAINDGDIIEVDANDGVVRILERK